MELPYERLAMRGEPMPNGLSAADQMAYQGLSYLYSRYYSGSVDRDSASKEKRKIVIEREKGLMRDKLSKNSAEFFKTVEWYASHYRKERTIEAADRLVDAVDGFLRGVPWEKEGD